MGPSDQLPDAPGSPPQAQPAEVVLRTLGQDLEALHRQVSSYLTTDITQLQARRQRLMADVEALETEVQTLQAQHQQLQASYSEALTQQQLAQQQVWAKRLAVALATHLQGRLEATLAQAAPAPPGRDGIAPLTSASQLASQHLGALDTTLQSTLASLQQDLSSYHSSLSQQIGRMQSLEQQGEAILEALVARLSQQLQTQLVPPPPTNGHSRGTSDLVGPALPRAVYRGPQPRAATYPGSPPPEPAARAIAPPPAAAQPSPPPPSSPRLPQDSAAPSTAGSLRLGIALVVLSTLALSLHNVVVGVIGYGGQVLGRIPVEAVFPLTIPNSLFLLWLRMVVVVPLLALVAQRLHPGVWRDLRQLAHSGDRRPVVQVVASGGFLFLSQVLIYKAIADVGPGVAVTLLFMYPLITVPLAWVLFGDRPTPLRLVVMFAISMGIVFTALPRIYADLSGSGVSLWGVGAALLASVAFALFLIAMQLSFRRIHPVSVSLMQFCTIFILTSAILIVGSFFGLDPDSPVRPSGLYLGAGLLGLLTLVGYLLNNYGVKLLGAAQASILAASGPVVTAVLAYLLTPGEKSALLFIQWMGVVLVTLGVISLSLERLHSQRRQASRRSAVPANTGQWH